MSASFPFGVSTPNGIEARASRLRSFLAHPVALASNRRQRICSSFASSNPSSPASQSGLCAACGTCQRTSVGPKRREHDDE
jgi:hypothetical protein